MRDNFFSKNSSEFDKLKHRFETTLKGIREEFDDHLESINDNTNEIQANYEYITKIDEKLRKISEKLDQMELWMFQTGGVVVKEDDDQHLDLNEKEKRAFLIIYTASQPVTYSLIAEALNENEFLIRGYVTNMLEKGIPIQKKYRGRQVYLSLDKEFKEKQAKHNIVGINQKTVKEFLM